MLINIPDFAVVTILSKREGAATILLSKIEPATLIDASVNRPDDLKRNIKRELDDHQSVAFHLPHSHEAGRKIISREARTAGAASVVIRIGADADQVDAAAEKHQHLYEIDYDDLVSVEIARSRMPADLTHLSGGFDIIGDIHGCASELLKLLSKLGHAVPDAQGGAALVTHPDGRRVVLVGDLTDRGPRNYDALQIAYRLHQEFGAIVVMGNHDFKLVRWLRGSNVRQAAGLQMTVAELERISQADRDRLADWLGELTTHYLLDGGKLVVAHAGLAEHLHGRTSKESDAFAMFGSKSEYVAEDGTPILLDWAADYKGTATVVHGHVVTDEPRVVNNVVSIDTGCVFGGNLTAYRYPEREFVSVPAERTYHEYKARVVASQET